MPMTRREFAGAVNSAGQVLIYVQYGRRENDGNWVPIPKQTAREAIRDDAKEEDCNEIFASIEDGDLYIDGPTDEDMEAEAPSDGAPPEDSPEEEEEEEEEENE